MDINYTKKCFYSCLLTLLGLGQVFGQNFEAENATLTNGAVKTVCSVCSGGFMVEQKEGDLAFNIDIAETGFYNIYVNAASPGGEKFNAMKIGENSTDFHLEQNSEYIKLKVVSTYKLNAGSNKIEIIKSWGWINIDFIELEKVSASDRFNLNQSLVTPNPTPEAANLYGFLLDNYGKRIISGVMTLDSLDEAIWLKSKTEKEPALLGIDFMHSGRGYTWYNDEMPILNAKTWYEKRGIPALMWHWRDPSRTTEEFYTDKTSFDISKISDVDSPEYAAMLADIDYTAGLLKKLQDDNVPVIWRPLHEAAGGWFWWGAKGPEPLKKLWRLMFDRMVNYHGLKNLIWVWTSEPGDDDWYPGDEYVDIVGRDIYKDGDHNSQVLEFNALNDKFEGKKMITLSEVGSFPDADNLLNDGASWSWYMPWYGNYTESADKNPLDLWEKMFSHPYVITLDSMPDLNSYERHEVKAISQEEEPEEPGVTTGISWESNQTNSFSVYPTLVENELIIKGDKRIASVVVFDVLGRTIIQEKEKGSEVEISFKGIRPGLYLIRINGAETVRVVKK